MSEQQISKAWYVIKDNQQLGPYSTEELKILVERGSIEAQTMIYPAKALKVDDLNLGDKKFALVQSAYFKIFIFIFLLLLFPSYEIYTNFWNPFSRPSKMNVETYRKMLLASRISSSSVNFEWAADTDNSKWWFSTNYPYEIDVEVTIESYEDGLLQQKLPVLAKGVGRIKNKFFTIDKLKFEKGLRLEMGRYKLSLKSVGRKEGIRLLPLLNGKKWPASFTWTDDLYIGVKNYGEWVNLIEQKKLAEKEKKAQEINDSIQHWETLKTILEQLRKKFNDLAKLKKRNIELPKWLEHYKSNTAPLLTGLLKSPSDEQFRQIIESTAAQVMETFEQLQREKGQKSKPGEAFLSGMEQCEKRIEALRAIEKAL